MQTILTNTATDIMVALKDRATILTYLILTAMFALTGPFGSFLVLDLWGRIGMWTAVMATTGIIGLTTFFLTRNLLPQNTHIATAIAILITSIPTSYAALQVDNFYLNVPISLSQFAVDWRNLLPVVILIVCLIGLTKSAKETTTLNHPKPIPLLDRLPDKIGQTLISVSAEDHYTKVTTTKGSELLLMRFSDAVTELTAYDGLRVHRSHWVSRAAVKRAHRNNGRVFIDLTNRAQIPVSRSFIPILKSRGLLQ